MTVALAHVDKKTAELRIGHDVVELEIPRKLQEVKVSSSSKPAAELRLNHVYGYRGRDSHKTLIYLSKEDELVYFSAAIVILNNLSTNKQRFYRKHDGNIRCIALHPNKTLIATGQEQGMGKKTGLATVHVWKIDTLETLRIIGSNKDFHYAVIQVAFSIHDEGGMLSIVSFGDFHVLSVWNWDMQILVAKPYEYKNPILDVEFNPYPTIPTELVSFGRGLLFSWLILSNATLAPTPIYPHVINRAKHEISYFTCFTFAPSADILVGDSDGYLHTFLRDDRRVAVRVHTGSDAPLFCMHFLPTACLVTGNSDGLVAMWDCTYHIRLKSFVIDHAYGAARSIISLGNGHLYAGTNKNCIVQTNCESEFKPFMMGHTSEVCGLCSGSQTNFVTCGKDKRVIMWDTNRHVTIWASEVRYEARCCAISASNIFVAVGCYTGHWVLINAKLGHCFNEGRACYHPIECIGFSPVDTYLAMGTQSGEIFIFVVTENNLTPQGKLTMPHGPTTHLDWAVDSYHIRTCSDDKKIYYWSIPLCKPDDSDYVKYDHYWWTKTCTVSYALAGIWTGAEERSDVKTSCVNITENLVASGDDFGRVKVQRYPCVTMFSTTVSDSCHGKSVRNIDFLKRRPRIISVGGDDYTIVEWKVEAAFG